MNIDHHPNLFDDNAKLLREVDKYREECRRWSIQCEELRKVVIAHQAKTRMEVNATEKLKKYESKMQDIVRLLRKNNLGNMADGIAAWMEELQ